MRLIIDFSHKSHGTSLIDSEGQILAPRAISSQPRESEGQNLFKSYNISTQRLSWLESSPKSYVTSLRDSEGQSFDLRAISSQPRDCKGQSLEIRAIAYQPGDSYG